MRAAKLRRYEVADFSSLYENHVEKNESEQKRGKYVFIQQQSALQ